MKKYNIIYADPPWRYRRKGVQGAAEKHYPTMSVDELCCLPISELFERDSVLFLWATFPQLREALQVIKAWGFEYKSVAFVWLKLNKSGKGWFLDARKRRTLPACNKRTPETKIEPSSPIYYYSLARS